MDRRRKSDRISIVVTLRRVLSRPGLLSTVFWSLGLVWLVCATGRVTIYLNVLKVAPGFALFTLSFLLSVIDRRGQDPPGRANLSPLLLLMLLHLTFLTVRSATGSATPDPLYVASLGAFSLLAVATTQRVVKRAKMPETIFLGSTIAVGVASAAGVLEFLGFFLARTNSRVGAVASFFVYPNVFGGFLVLLLPLAYAHPLIRKCGVSRVVTAGSAALALSALALTRSKAALVAVAAGACVFAVLHLLFLTRRRGVRRLSTLLPVAAVVVATGLGLVLLPPFREKILSVRAAWATRQVPYRIASGLWTTSPVSVLFGHGMGSFVPLTFTHKPADHRLLAPEIGWDGVHNEYLEQLVDGGVVGLLLFLAVCTYIVVKALRFIADRRVVPTQRVLCTAMLAGVVGFLVDGFFSTNARVPFILFFFYLLCAAIEALSQRVGTTDCEAAGHVDPLILAGRRHVQRVLPVLVLCIAVGANIRVWMRFVSEIRLARGLSEHTELELSQTHLRRGARADPWNVDGWYFLARNALLSRNYDELDRSADEVEDLVPSFRDIFLVRATAAVGRGAFRDAGGHLSSYLEHNLYDTMAEVMRTVLLALDGQWRQATDALSVVIEHDITARKWVMTHPADDGTRSSARVLFPSDREVIRRIEVEGPPVLEIGRPSMELLVRAVVEAPGRSLNEYVFRLHYVLGKTYAAFEMSEEALRHLRLADEHSTSVKLSRGWQSGNTANSRSDNEARFHESDPARFEDMRHVLSELLLRLAAEARRDNALQRELDYLSEHYRRFHDAMVRERLVDLHRGLLNFKAMRVLTLQEGASR